MENGEQSSEFVSDKLGFAYSLLRKWAVRRIEQKSLAKDQFYAYPMALTSAVGIFLNGDRKSEFYDQVNTEAFRRLSVRAIEAQLVSPRRDLGNGLEDGRLRIQVCKRDGEPAGFPLVTDENTLGVKVFMSNVQIG